MEKSIERAQTIVEALPYIQNFRGKIVVIKYGGNAMINQDLMDSVMDDVILLNYVGIHVVLVHGGGPEINAMLKKIGKESTFIDGLRYTDEETMDVVQSVLCGKVNKDLVASIVRKGSNAIGLSGLDDGILQAIQKTTNGKDYGLVGVVTKVNPQPIVNAIEKNVIPIIATVALGTDKNTSYNVNADTAAADLAIALKAEKLMILTDTVGVLKEEAGEKVLITSMNKTDVEKYIDKGVITGGMIPKVECCINAIQHGVTRTHIIDGRVPHSILIEILTDEGVGTMIY